jgi:hypothetical protein
MCDCADSCSRMSIDQVERQKNNSFSLIEIFFNQIDKIYGQSSATRGDKSCFWRTYTQSLNNELPSLSSP